MLLSYLVLKRFGDADFDKSDSVKRTGGQYNHLLLIRLTYEYARSEESQDRFLEAFFWFIGLPLDGEDDADIFCSEAKLYVAIFHFAEYLMDNFFPPRKTDSHLAVQEN